MPTPFGFGLINTPFLVIISIWSIIWKGIALWKSARHSQKPWFVVMLIVNTAGILEIVYILFFQKTPVIQHKMPPKTPKVVKKAKKKK